MPDHYAAPTQPAAPEASASTTPVTTVGPKPNDRTRRRSALSSPMTWLSLATLLVAVIIYLFVAPIPVATQAPAERQTVPAQR